MTVYRFASFEFDSQLLTLIRHGETVSLRPKTAELLSLFLERRNLLLSKPELLRIVWQDSHVSDSVLFQTISELRRALHTKSRDCPFLRNLKGQGYVWIYAEVTVTTGEGAAEPEAVALAPALGAPEPLVAPRLPPASMRPYLAFLSVMIGVLTVVLLSFQASPRALRREAGRLNLGLLAEAGTLPETAGLLPLMASTLDEDGRLLTDLALVPNPLPEDRVTTRKALKGAPRALLRVHLKKHGKRFALKLVLERQGDRVWSRTVYGPTRWRCIQLACDLVRGYLCGPGVAKVSDLGGRGEVVSALFSEAESGRRKGDFKRALALYQNALMVSPEDSMLVLGFGLSLAGMGEVEDARRLLEQAYAQAHRRQAHSLERACIEGLAHVAQHAGDLGMERYWRRRLLQVSASWSAGPRLRDQVQLANCLTHMGKGSEAESLYEEALKQVADFEVTALALKLALADCYCARGLQVMALGQYAEVLGALARVDAPQLRVKAQLHYTAALVATGDLEGAANGVAPLLAQDRCGDGVAQMEGLMTLAAHYQAAEVAPMALACLQRVSVLASGSQDGLLKLRLAYGLAQAQLRIDPQAGRKALAQCQAWIETEQAQHVFLGFGPEALERLERAYSGLD